jgi:glutaredoxin
MSLHCQVFTVSGVKCGTAVQGKIVLCTKHEETVKPKYVCEDGVCRMINSSDDARVISDGANSLLESDQVSQILIATIFTTNPQDAKSLETRLQQLGFDVVVKQLDTNEMQSQFGMDCSDIEVFINDRYIDDVETILSTSKEATIYSPSQFKCTYCDDANDLLVKYGYHVTRLKLTDEKLRKKFGASFTVPKIFIGNTYIGGFSDLKSYLQ